jgi:CRP-like cAMP-binding protein
MATATAMTACTVVVVEKQEMVRQLHAKPAFADRFLRHMLRRNIRSRVNFFMNKFRKLGFIEYNGGLKINNSLLSVVLRD